MTRRRLALEILSTRVNEGDDDDLKIEHGYDGMHPCRGFWMQAVYALRFEILIMLGNISYYCDTVTLYSEYTIIRIIICTMDLWTYSKFSSLKYVYRMYYDIVVRTLNYYYYSSALSLLRSLPCLDDAALCRWAGSMLRRNK